MGNIRKVSKIITGRNAIDGAGVRLVRVIGYDDVKEFDPFLMMDAFDSYDPDDYTSGFPWHPHRGIETITYIVDGEIEHGDSLGNKGSIKDGDCQWMTSGSGIIHQEMPKPSERLFGVQLWLNMPAEYKMSSPSYGDIKNKDIPIVNESGSRVHVIAGEYNGTKGAFEGKYVKATYLDVELASGSEWYLDSGESTTLFVYILKGEGIFAPESNNIIEEKHAVLFDAGQRFWVKASERGMRFLLLAGKPLNEPVAWGGPIVMNTQQELNTAFKELDEGTFIKS